MGGIIGIGEDMSCGPACKEIGKMLIGMGSYKIVLGLFLGWILSIAVGECFAKFTRIIQNNFTRDIMSLKRNTITEEIKKKWKNVVDIGEELTRPNRWLGRFEATFFYICLLFFGLKGIGAWLVFKVAVKWESWANIAKVPDRIGSGENKIDDFEFLELRNKLATIVSQKFLIGTLGNILAATMGFGLYWIIRCV